MTFLDSLRERAETATGLAFRPVEEVARLEEVASQYDALSNEAEELAIHVMDYVSGRPQEVQADRRRALSQKSRVAIIRDPLAGAEANLRANFAFGSGIPKPQAADEEVQKIIDEAWDDPVNKRKLTGFEAQRHRSNEMLAAANLFPVAFRKNGRVRIGFHDADLVTDVVTAEEDDETPLWYVVRRKRSKWDFEMHTQVPLPDTQYDGLEQVWYVKHWRNVDDAEKDAADWGTEKPPKPPESKVLDGDMEHFRINRVGRTQFGVPPMARTLRFYSAMNQLTEAQVAMRQAAATIVAKRTRRGGPKDLMKAAGTIMGRSGELASARFGASPRNAGPGTDPPYAAAPPPAGSFWMENEGDNLQAVNLSSGSSQAAQDAQIVRAPIAAAVGFGQHYLGDPGSTNLATASTLELPTQMEVSAWQETFEQLLRWFVDLALEEAVRAGRLGGMAGVDSDGGDARPLNELRIEEDRAEMERRTDLDLSYSLEMPYPGRRNLTDVTQTVSAVMAAYDPGMRNNEMRRGFLDFLLRHGLQVEDPARLVDEMWPEDGPDYVKEQVKREEEDRQLALDAYKQQNGPPNPDPDADRSAAPQLNKDPRESGDKSQYGERRRATPPSPGMAQSLEEQMLPPELRSLLHGDVDAEFAKILDDPRMLSLTNGGPKRGPAGTQP